MEDAIEKIKSLKLKGFSENEISSILGLGLEQIRSVEVNKDIMVDTFDLYSEMQKDLSKLILTEMGKDTRDSTVILNAIRLQSELQEKKIKIKKGDTSTKIDTDYLSKRDEEIVVLTKQGLQVEDIAKRFNISVLSVKLALDRIELNLPESVKYINPSIISETRGLDREKRIEILERANKESLTRDEVRQIVNKIKNEMRCS